VLRRLHRFIERKEASFRKKDINNMVDLPRKIGFREEILPFAILGFVPLEGMFPCSKQGRGLIII